MSRTILPEHYLLTPATPEELAALGYSKRYFGFVFKNLHPDYTKLPDYPGPKTYILKIPERHGWQMGFDGELYGGMSGSAELAAEELVNEDLDNLLPAE